VLVNGRWPESAALYESVVRHARTTPVRHSFAYRTYHWLVDLDEMPRPAGPLRLLARFDSGAGIRAGLASFLAGKGVDLRGGKVLMLAHARMFGHVFNPLTVYWCHNPDGSPACVVAEVHNTYGESHRYLLRPDAQDRASTPKEFYVSPFFAVEGGYRMRLPEPDGRLALTIALEQGGGRPFVATLRGRRQPATPATLLRATARHAWVTAAVSARIRLHGIRLYLRGLPVIPRPLHQSQEGTP
jgi:DUF1365 family protein